MMESLSLLVFGLLLIATAVTVRRFAFAKDNKHGNKATDEVS
jgi:hypothetical protein